MAVDHNSEQGRVIRKRIPLNTMPGPLFETLCKYISVEQQPSGYQLFQRGDKTDELFYLLEGDVTLKAGGYKIETITADSELANFALAHQMPRKIGAVANSAITFLRLPPDVLKKLQASSINIEQKDMIVEHEEDRATDWMTKLLKSPIFQLVPAANLQKTLFSLQEVDTKKDTIIVEQDEYPGDFYYIIKSGVCALTRKPTKNAKPIVLGKLSAGDSFGEASILSEKPRELTVTAATDVTLLKLDKENFLTLIRNPSLTFINSTTISQELKNGSLLIDIRTAEEFEEFHITGSINIPYFSIRMAIKTLDHARKIMVFCANGKLSEAAAFSLIRNKFTVAIVEGGLEQYQLKNGLHEKANFTIDDPDSSIEDEQDLENVEDDIEVQAHVENHQEQSTSNIIEMPLAFEELSETTNTNQSQGLSIESSTLIEAKIQVLRDENRELLRSNMRLELQYEELLKQKEMLELQLQNVKNKQG